ncbi:MAG: hypothetical protein J7575_03855 [Chloroflexi bacterium]|jgi:hypothetical protein|nr:hypothetical protein [Chloroflexota bacterium]
MTSGPFVLLLVLAFVLGEATVLGTQFWLVDRKGKLSRHLSLGTLILGLFSVPTAISVLTFLVRGP